MKIELYRYYYYRGEDHIPRRITIVEKGPKPGFYWVVEGHWYKHQIFEKKLVPFLIYQNKITL